MPDLVALELPQGPGFVDALTAVWEAGDAAWPVDLRLPPPARARLFEALRPGVRVDGEGRWPVEGGIGVEAGDALIVATSGTTGEPKGVVLTHAAVAASAAASSGALGVDPSRDRWVACLPVAHVGGLSVVTRALLTGTPLVVLPRFDADAVERAAGRDGATLISLVGTALARTDVSGYRAVLVGGGAPPPSLPANAVTTYGLTETGSGVVYDGRPLDGVELRIGDGRLGREGEILLRGPMLLRAYRGGGGGPGGGLGGGGGPGSGGGGGGGGGTDPKLAGGWLATGDEGTLDAEGRLTVYGRGDEVIVTGGQKVWPAPVERVLAAHSGIAEVAVTGRADPQWGQRVVAWVVPAASPAPSLAELRELVSAELAPWAAPKEIELVAALPRTPLGKVRRTDLV